MQQMDERKENVTDVVTSRFGAEKNWSIFHPVVHEWKGMGIERFCYPPKPPICSWFAAFILLIYISLGSACDIVHCQTLFSSAKDAEKSTEIKKLAALQRESPRCISLRTYIDCLVKQKRFCHSDITFNGNLAGLKAKMNRHKCSADPEASIFDPETMQVTGPRPPSVDRMCSYSGKPIYKQCGLFGDPHLRMFNEEFQTCKVEGAWALVDNKHLTVQVTNDPVINSGDATATSKLTVIIKKNEDCASSQFITYTAQTGHLPGSFSLGQTHYGPERSVEVIEKEPGKSVVIYLRYIDTTIKVQQIGRYFTFAIKMPEGVLNSSEISDKLELCVQGCPINERINYKQYFSEVQRTNKHSKMALSKALKMCRDASVVDFYFDSCVFDLLTTGDENFTAAAYQAWQDLIELNPELRQTQDNRTELPIVPSSASSEKTKFWYSSRILLLSVLLCVLLSMPS
ncbi:repulsive guidance molecule A-like isoform X1 [Mytilus californianus]|uniref:repulsive guidance molecule A-like isoform X1 n=1 Tax=Mytilus californianus TaxID=6549 RepID=UPI00224684E9|nr:repulsive guidance molecule A-like isoform X1 [Mytilus californianus]